MYALMKDRSGFDHLAIAWQYPGKPLEVIPARFSMNTRPPPSTNTVSAPTWMQMQQVHFQIQLWCKLLPYTTLARLLKYYQY